MKHFIYILGDVSINIPIWILWAIILSPIFIMIIIIFKDNNKELKKLEKQKKEKHTPKEIPIKKTDQIDDPAMVRFKLEEKKIEKDNITNSEQNKNSKTISQSTDSDNIEELI